MPKSPLQKSLQEYISKIKKKSPLQKSLQECVAKIKNKSAASLFRIRSKSLSLSNKRYIIACKHPRTRSFSHEHTRRSETPKTDHDEAATLEDVDRFLFENFKSLYMTDRDVDVEKAKRRMSNVSSRFINQTPDVCGFRRFFEPTELTTFDDVASNSSATPTDITDTSLASIDVATSNMGSDSKKVMGPEDFITLLTYSPNPYDEFKKSMQEMVDARVDHHGKIDWNFMEELLSCFMNLNHKKSYKYILSAFVDLVVTLREDSDSDKFQRDQGDRQLILRS